MQVIGVGEISSERISGEMFSVWGLEICFFQAEDGIRDAEESRGLGDVYKRQVLDAVLERAAKPTGERNRKAHFRTIENVVRKIGFHRFLEQVLGFLAADFLQRVQSLSLIHI